jgi:hypothetical protein
MGYPRNQMKVRGLFTAEKEPLYPLNLSMSGPLGRYERSGGEKRS